MYTRVVKFLINRDNVEVWRLIVIVFNNFCFYISPFNIQSHVQKGINYPITGNHRPLHAHMNNVFQIQ